MANELRQMPYVLTHWWNQDIHLIEEWSGMVVTRDGNGRGRSDGKKLDNVHKNSVKEGGTVSGSP
jgi:hypothetical protein